MFDRLHKWRTFGVDDKLPCPTCGKPMSLTRRAPDDGHDLQYERQTFTCFACDHETERVVDAEGNSPLLRAFGQ